MNASLRTDVERVALALARAEGYELDDAGPSLIALADGDDAHAKRLVSLAKVAIGALRTVLCPYCGRPSELIGGAELYPDRPDLHERTYWSCAPCGAYVGCHPHSDRALGTLANASLRKQRAATHAAFDPLWKPAHVTLTRSKAFEWLARAMGLTKEQCHVAMFTEVQCKEAMKICNTKREHDAAERKQALAERAGAGQ